MNKDFNTSSVFENYSYILANGRAIMAYIKPAFILHRSLMLCHKASQEADNDENDPDVSLFSARFCVTKRICKTTDRDM